MNAVDWDDPDVEAQWCDERRKEVGEYLSKEGLDHGEIGSWPAWHVAPYVSLWAIESLKNPGTVGWWAISGDLPTDYISSSDAHQPRRALRVFADIWDDVASHMREGKSHPSINIGSLETKSKLIPLLEKRSEALRRFAEDDSIWGDDENFAGRS